MLSFLAPWVLHHLQSMDEIRDAWEQGSLAASLETDLATRVHVSRFHMEEGKADRYLVLLVWALENRKRFPWAPLCLYQTGIAVACVPHLVRGCPGGGGAAVPPSCSPCGSCALPETPQVCATCTAHHNLQVRKYGDCHTLQKRTQSTPKSSVWEWG